MNEFSFDLIGIFREIFKKKNFILILTAAALIISFIFCSLQQKKYTSETIFIVKNPLLIDRNFVFRNTSYEHREFFAVPDDVDHVKTIAKSDGLLWHLIDNFGLAKAYHMEQDDGRLVKEVKGNFKTVMEDTKNIQLYYSDPDPERARKITTAARDYIERTFLNYFLTTNKDITDALKEKAAAMRDTITKLDDSITNIRTTVGNYTQLLPSRGTSIASGSQYGDARNAGAMEHLREITAIKDKLSDDVATYESLVNEYEVMANGKIHIFYIIQEAYKPGANSHPKTLIITAVSTLVALFFACILVLISAFYRKVMGTKPHNAA